MMTLTDRRRELDAKIARDAARLDAMLTPRPQTCPSCRCTHTAMFALCGDCADARIAAEAAEEAAEKVSAKRRYWHDICPDSYRRTNWHDPRLSPVCTALAQQWQPAEKLSLILSGETGLGKTRAGFAILRRMLHADYSVYAVHAGDAWDRRGHVQGLSSATRLQYSDEVQTQLAAEECLARARSADYLLIDDLGKERTGSDGKLSEAVAETIYGLIEHRCARRKPTIMTSNAGQSWLQLRFSGDKAGPFFRRLEDDFAAPQLNHH